MTNSIETILLQACVDSQRDKAKFLINKLSQGEIVNTNKDMHKYLPVLNNAADQLESLGAPILRKTTEITTDRFESPDLFYILILRSGINPNHLNIVKNSENNFTLNYAPAAESKIRNYAHHVLKTSFKPCVAEVATMPSIYAKDKGIDVDELRNLSSQINELIDNPVILEEEHQIAM